MLSQSEEFVTPSIDDINYMGALVYPFIRVLRHDASCLALLKVSTATADPHTLVYQFKEQCFPNYVVHYETL